MSLFDEEMELAAAQERVFNKAAALVKERDELRAQLETMRKALQDILWSSWVECNAGRDKRMLNPVAADTFARWQKALATISPSDDYSSSRSAADLLIEKVRAFVPAWRTEWSGSQSEPTEMDLFIEMQNALAALDAAREGR